MGGAVPAEDQHLGSFFTDGGDDAACDVSAVAYGRADGEVQRQREHDFVEGFFAGLGVFFGIMQRDLVGDLYHVDEFELCILCPAQTEGALYELVCVGGIGDGDHDLDICL